MIRILLSCNADINIKDKNGNIPIQLCHSNFTNEFKQTNIIKLKQMRIYKINKINCKQLKQVK